MFLLMRVKHFDGMSVLVDCGGVNFFSYIHSKFLSPSFVEFNFNSITHKFIDNSIIIFI